MEPFRIIQIFVVQLGLGIAYLIIGLLVLKRDRKRLNQIISIFYISIFIGFAINVVYAVLEINPLVTILHYATAFFLFWPPCMLFIFNIIILKSQKIFDTKKQLAVGIVYAILILGMVFIPNGATLSPATNWAPVWNLGFTIYVLALSTVYVIGPTTYTALKINKAFQDKALKKKWSYYIIGIWANFILFYGTVVKNYIADPTFSLIWSIIGVFLTIINIVGVYVGIGRQLKRKEPEKETTEQKIDS